MGFPHLPSELLAMIASYIMPYDFEHLSLTCKKVFELARPLIPRHNEYRRKYRNFSFGSSSLETISDLLAVIAEDLIIATYMVHVELDGRIHCKDCKLNNAAFVERMTKRLAPLVLGSPHLSMLGEEFNEPAKLWLREIVQDLSYYKKAYCNQVSHFAEFGVPLLLTLFVNVETLTLPENWCHDTTHANRHVTPIPNNRFHPDDKRKMYKNGKRVWRLVSVLPESLETLIIHTPAVPQNSACVERMFWRFEELRAQRLPKLKQIEVHMHTRYPTGRRIKGHSNETRRLKSFFADKMILTKFEKL